MDRRAERSLAWPVDDDEYRRHSYAGLLAAAEYGDESAREALKQFLRRTCGWGDVIVERHPRQGWRVRKPER